MSSDQSPSLHGLLDRHQLRRLQSIPTLTVLAGPVGAGIHLWQTWCRRRTVPVVRATPVPADLALVWAGTLARHYELEGAAIAWLAHRTGRPTQAWQGRLAAMTRHDLDRLWQAEGLELDATPGTALCRWLLGLRLAGKPLTPLTVAEDFLKDFSPGDPTGTRLVRAFTDLVPADRLPAILASPEQTTDLICWLETCSHTLGSFIRTVPALPAAITTPANAIEQWTGRSPPSHHQDLVREGLVVVPGLDETALTQRLRAEGMDPAPLAATVRRLAAGGASEELAAALAEAASNTLQPETPESEDRARSTQERFLFELLESLPETAGLFALNQQLEFPHGVAAAEADFLAAELKLVIELDGSYYHFADKDAYRRDRRKDWQLQRHGYLVLRFLADDVVSRLEEILDTILAAVAWRRRSFPQGERFVS
jgi:very-short-patch-repair endonuclease